MERTEGRLPRGGGRPLVVLLPALLFAMGAGAASAQAGGERVDYENPADGTPLTALLTLPEGAGPFPALVVLSLAGVEGLVDRMARLGWAVIVPERRGMRGSPHLILRAAFRDMAADVAAARAYLRSRPEIDPAAWGLLAQGAETQVGMLAAVEPPVPDLLVLVSAAGIPGDETFRAEQRHLAGGRGLAAGEVEALDGLVERLAGIVRAEDAQPARERRIRALLGAAAVRPYQSSSFPADVEGQVRFFSSRWWRDWFTFAPDSVLARVRSPTLVLVGRDDPFVSFERNLPPVLRALEAAATDDVTPCVVEGRVEHGFPPGALDAVEAWVRARTGPADPAGMAARPGADPPRSCLDDPDAP